MSLTTVQFQEVYEATLPKLTLDVKQLYTRHALVIGSFHGLMHYYDYLPLPIC